MHLHTFYLHSVLASSYVLFGNGNIDLNEYMHPFFEPAMHPTAGSRAGEDTLRSGGIEGWSCRSWIVRNIQVFSLRKRAIGNATNIPRYTHIDCRVNNMY